jgi:hypothetical protein
MRKRITTIQEAAQLVELVAGKPVRIDPRAVEKRRSQLEHTADKYFGKPELDPRNL